MLEILAKQFRKPEGLLGRIVGRIMSFDNRKINTWTLNRLQIKPGDIILEIGFGPGAAIEDMFKRQRNLRIDGIDLSHDMLKVASTRNLDALKKKKLRLFEGDLLEIEEDFYQYDKVVSVNNYPLWKDKQSTLKRIYQLMKNNGVIAITVQPREEDASRKKTFAHAHEIEQALYLAGFRNISVKFKKIAPELTVCVTAVCKK